LAARAEAQKRGEYRGEAVPFGFTYDAEGMASRAIRADLVRLGIKLSHVAVHKIVTEGAKTAHRVRHEGS
jgi:hypothetical protein